MHNNAAWHGCAPKTEDYEIAVKELNDEIVRLGGERV